MGAAQPRGARFGLPGSSSFLGLQAGPQLTVTPTGGGAQNLIGLIHYDGPMTGTDLLPAMLIGRTAILLVSGLFGLGSMRRRRSAVSAV